MTEEDIVELARRVTGRRETGAMRAVLGEAVGTSGRSLRDFEAAGLRGILNNMALDPILVESLGPVLDDFLVAIESRPHDLWSGGEP